MPFSSFLVFIIFNILAAAYNISALGTIMGRTPAMGKLSRRWWQLTKHIVYANQIVFGASVIIHALTSYGFLPAMIDIVTSYCFILSGTINLLAVFYLTPFYISYISHPTKKHILAISLAIILSSIYAIFHMQFMLELLNILKKSEVYKFFNPLSRYIPIPLFVVGGFSVMINIYFLDILLHLHRKTAKWKRFFIDCIMLGAGLNFFILCYFAFEAVLLFIPDNPVTDAFFHHVDRGGALFRLFLLAIIPAINLFFISILTPFYARSKFKESASSPHIHQA